MPKFNIDEQKSLFEPIEIILNSKQYIIKEVSSETLSKVMELGKKAKGDKDNIDANIAIKQFALLAKVDEEKLKKIDIRKIGMALNFITKEITKQTEDIAGKNASKAEGKK